MKKTLSPELIVGLFAKGIFGSTIPLENALAFLGDYVDIPHLQEQEGGEVAVPTSQAPFSVWKTIDLGTYESVKTLRVALKKVGNIGDWASYILGKPAFILSKEKVPINLVKVSVADLGFPEGATLGEIYARAKERGLQLCPAEVGPQLRLQYKDQPYGEYLRIAMEPISDSGGDPRVFSVDRDGDELWLRADCDRPSGWWSAGDLRVFSVVQVPQLSVL